MREEVPEGSSDEILTRSGEMCSGQSEERGEKGVRTGVELLKALSQ